jgi:DnaJ-domain-containing protein 1
VSLGSRFFDLVRSNVSHLFAQVDDVRATAEVQQDAEPEDAGPPRRVGGASEADRLRWYRALDLAPGADLAAVRRAYRRQIARFHPDRFAHDPDKQRDAAVVARALTDAYENLRRELAPA